MGACWSAFKQNIGDYHPSGSYVLIFESLKLSFVECSKHFILMSCSFLIFQSKKCHYT